MFGFVKLDSVLLQVIRRSQELRCGHIRLRGCKRAWAFFDRETQTERIIRAVSNPYTTILGHMTGRQLLRRPGYEIDIEKVLVARAEHGVAIEINANPWRLDLDWRSHEAALRLGCVMSINPDAHSTREIDLTPWGVEMTRKGGVPKDRVLNCLCKDELSDYLKRRRARRRTKAAPHAAACSGHRQVHQPRSRPMPVSPQIGKALRREGFAGTKLSVVRFPAYSYPKEQRPWPARRTCRNCFTTL